MKITELSPLLRSTLTTFEALTLINIWDFAQKYRREEITVVAGIEGQH